MTTPKERHRAIIEGYFYACCPFCKNTLMQGKNGTDCILRCSTCGDFIKVIVTEDTVTTQQAKERVKGESD